MDLKCPYCGYYVEIEEYGYPYDETTYHRIACGNSKCGAKFSQFDGTVTQEGKESNPPLVDRDGDRWVWRQLLTGDVGYVCDDTWGDPDIPHSSITVYTRELVERLHGPVRVDNS
jgi:hypothetical protein